jgi:hypothetical protein
VGGRDVTGGDLVVPGRVGGGNVGGGIVVGGLGVGGKVGGSLVGGGLMVGLGWGVVGIFLPHITGHMAIWIHCLHGDFIDQVTLPLLIEK